MEQIKFKRILGMKGESLAITLPKEIAEWLNISNGDELTITGNEGKHGKFAAVFKEEKRGD
jgi:antitoxin component of MazEF toxin-antitoxin module